MINVKDGMNLLMDMGLKPVIVTDPDDSNIEHFFIENEVVWDKLFFYLKENEPELQKSFETVPHYNWIKNIILSRNPKLQSMKIEGKDCYVVVFKEIQERENLKHLNSCLGFTFLLVSALMKDRLSQFE